eukprot:TRINITY_DN50499_c0_g1_i1.p1 TRINITY_DN50499_c0_g1~~TRINITY_DN50499_c0_g1_i1.p1  ORF type:complete len:359 (-),score=29.24 TRINITY_DN50499_c0_g1_i1:154-1230(-)
MASCRRCCCRCCSSIGIVSTLVVFLAMILNRGYPDDLPAANSARQPYVEGQTVVRDYPMNFSSRDKRAPVLNMGVDYILMQSAPKWFQAIMTAIFGKTDKASFTDSLEEHNITFLDARQEDIDFVKSGFTLLSMPQKSVTQDWRSQEDVKHFHAEIEPAIRKLYPTVKRLVWTYNVVRNGDRFGDQPAAVNGFHLDYSQNDSARREFHKVYPAFDQDNAQKLFNGGLLEENEEMRVMLGVWKPISMNTSVCDKPLAIIDASTFVQEDELPFHLHINFGVFTFHNLNGAVAHSPKQKVYYYPFQTEQEVLVFQQYSHGRHFANPHGSFLNPNCPPESQPRLSVELRVGLLFDKGAPSLP